MADEDENAMVSDGDFYKIMKAITKKALENESLEMLSALNIIKQDLKTRGFTTTDKRYIKAVLFPEYTTSGKIPGIYPIASTSFRLESSFDVVANQIGFFSLVFTPEALSNLTPACYLFTQGSIQDWGVPMNLRADGSLLSKNIYDTYNVPEEQKMNFQAFNQQTYTPSKRDPGIVFEKGRLVGASLSIIPYGEDGTIQGTIEGGIDYETPVPSIDFVTGASPKDILEFMLNYLEDTTTTVFGPDETDLSHEKRVRIAKTRTEFQIALAAAMANPQDQAPQQAFAAKKAELEALIGVSADTSPSIRTRILQVIDAKITTYGQAFDAVIAFIQGAFARVVGVGFWGSVKRVVGLKGPMDYQDFAAVKSDITLGMMMLECLSTLDKETTVFDEQFVTDYMSEVIEGVTSTFSQDHRITLATKLAEMLIVKTHPKVLPDINIDRLRNGSFHHEYDPNVGCRIVYLPRKEAQFMHINIASKKDQFAQKEMIGMYVCGNGMKPFQRCKVKLTRVIEALPLPVYREYLKVDKAMPDPRTIEIINYIHTGPTWMLRVPPKQLPLIYGRMKNSFGWFDMVLKRMQGEGQMPYATTLSGAQTKLLAITS